MMGSIPASFLITITALLLRNQPVVGDMFSASADLANTFRLEQQVVNVLGELVAQTEAKLGIIRQYLKDYESVVEEKAASEEEFMERVAGNPIHAYRLMKRLYFDWQTVEKEIKTDNWRNALRRLEQVRMGAKFPKEEDFFGAAQALVRLQDTYELNMTQLARGNLWGRQTRAELTAQDCLFMGKHAFNAGAYARAVEWFEESYILAGQENNRTLRQDQVMEFIQHAINMHDDTLQQTKKRHPMAVLSHTNSFRLPLKEKSAGVQRSEIIRSRKYNVGKHITDQDDATNFNALCRGETLLNDKVLAQLKCWYDSRRQPYFLLMPIKIEQNSMEPAIYTFHDVLSDDEIETIKELAKPLLARSMVQGRTGAGHEVSNVRTSKTAWLAEGLHPLLNRLTRRISLITGLKTNPIHDEAELLQVANYGIGGHYAPHHDYLMKGKADFELGQMPPQERAMGDRISTFMFYLNDVERGGSTAFPRAGVAVKPVRGGAAFWFNLKRSGKPDPLTLHGACPVLLGHKWVSNKWIRETAQTFNRRCTLDVNE
ncbi:prolyl 4-hydroxylase subunit alpha-1-like isoform X2 [Daphnia carinata]|uniref:prolyl 4-hydroxylase subunit alpha-1-like isoform X2 n=1 Tax=Daphnia carinata TaxID=120202 RepID=UPI00257F4860|nr:prolyl 4-hydroxylase subunit alpha-1-like isoform X2 [Daphnia carinata]